MCSCGWNDCVFVWVDQVCGLSACLCGWTECVYWVCASVSVVCWLVQYINVHLCVCIYTFYEKIIEKVILVLMIFCK